MVKIKLNKLSSALIECLIWMLIGMVIGGTAAYFKIHYKLVRIK